jgi:uncharacterized membrane protein YvbJ
MDSKNEYPCQICGEPTEYNYGTKYEIVCRECAKKEPTGQASAKQKTNKNGVLMKWSFTKIIIILTGLFLFYLIFIVAPKSKQEDRDAYEPRVENAIPGYERIGLIKELSPKLHEAYLDKDSWELLNHDLKELVAHDIAMYVGHGNGDYFYWVKIYDYQSGKKLGEYHPSSGLEFE